MKNPVDICLYMEMCKDHNPRYYDMFNVNVFVTVGKSAHTHFRRCPALLLPMCTHNISTFSFWLLRRREGHFISPSNRFCPEKKIQVNIDYLKNKPFRYRQGRRGCTFQERGCTPVQLQTFLRCNLSWCTAIVSPSSK